MRIGDKKDCDTGEDGIDEGSFHGFELIIRFYRVIFLGVSYESVRPMRKWL